MSSKLQSCPHCGCSLAPEKQSKPRSIPQHRRYFALIRGAFHHWPEKHERFNPTSEEHLRKWLQCKAGYHTVQTIDTDGMEPAQAVAAIAAAYEKAGPHPFTKASGTRLHVFASQSIDFDTLPHLAACALFDEVAAVIEAETNIRVDDMLRFTPRASKAERSAEVVRL